MHPHGAATSAASASAEKPAALREGRKKLVRAATCPIAECPRELLGEVGPRLLDRAQPVGRLACTSTELRSNLSSAAGLLRVGSVVATSLDGFRSALRRASSGELEALTVDLSGCGSGRYSRADIEAVLQELGAYLAGASALRRLSVRLASFDVAMERLRLGPETWEALIRGLSGLAPHGRLEFLELSHITIKASQATQAVPGCPARPSRMLRRRATDGPEPGSGKAFAASLFAPTGSSLLDGAVAAKAADDAEAPRTFLEVLGQLTELSELRLTHDEILGNTALMLPPVLTGLAKLERVDLTRNHIPKQVMDEVRSALPAQMKLSGEDKQTFFF